MNRFFSLWSLMLLMIISVCECQNVDCPPHCSCTDTEVTCENVNVIPTSLPNTTVYLTLSDNFIGPILLKIQVDRLSSLPLRQLSLSNNRLVAIENGAFDSLSQLQTLDISGNRISAITENSFAGLTNLEYLFANDAGIIDIALRAFASTPNIQEIDLEDNMLKTIGAEFGALSNLRELLLAQNDITEISPGAFSGLRSLSHLSLFGNQLNKPYDSWFRTIIDNNGIIELDYRFSANVREPNPWLCCPDVALFYNFIKRQNSSLQSYAQLDVSCTWPVATSGRLISTLSMEELNMMPCSAYSTSTVYPTSVDASTTTLGGQPPAIKPIDGNFLSNLNDAGVVFLLLFFLLIGASLFCGCCYCYKSKQGRKKLQSLTSSLRKGDADKKGNVELTTKPYRQETATYGATAPTKRPIVPPPPANKPARPTRPAPVAPSSGDKMRPVYTMETDYSEEEVWSKT